MNSICLLGRLTADPELRTTQTGIAVTGFKVAVDRSYTPKGQEKQVDFIPVQAWRQTAEFVCKYFRKGAADRADRIAANPVIHRPGRQQAYSL